MRLNTLNDLFVHELKDLQSAEKQIIRALPKMIKAATNSDLKAALESHLRETEEHADRLDRILAEVDASSRTMKCKAMEGLIEEGKSILADDMDDEVRDAAIICAAQRVEHYEIAGYGCARTFASQLGYDQAAQLLQQSLDEEKSADEKLTEIAVREVNAVAGTGER
jgi:ferritin-like metal-binding protein YciE